MPLAFWLFLIVVTWLPAIALIPIGARLGSDWPLLGILLLGSSGAILAVTLS